MPRAWPRTQNRHAQLIDGSIRGQITEYGSSICSENHDSSYRQVPLLERLPITHGLKECSLVTTVLRELPTAPAITWPWYRNVYKMCTNQSKLIQPNIHAIIKDIQSFCHLQLGANYASCLSLSSAASARRSWADP